MNFKAPIAQFMSKKPIVVSPKDRMTSVKEIFDQHNIHHVLVMDKTTLVGIISKEDYNQLVRPQKSSSYKKLVEESTLYNYSVEEIMTKDLLELESTEKISVALELFAKNIFRAIPIVDNGELVGLLTTHDIIQALVEENHAQFENKSVVT
jgi:CBS domain-containing protein